ncbi:MAG: hypothetical protein B7Z08_12265 [Sphingomonadales bacterium 32-68-7]|nr:MAG: hypothetical protein B7Z33_13280 [Sphingomonadales bacterium 12-68-11]OYX07511.1 MAG: hypothetical protein B7Z08_12265 [Sphingomonadales bacterium 32-68-7]
MLGLLAPLILQASTAAPIDATPLEAGRWVVRETRESRTGRGGISATLLADTGDYRLVVRCDFSYRKDISLQLLPATVKDPRPVRPAALSWDGPSPPFNLVWEEAGPGVFARNGQDDRDATAAALELEQAPGVLHFIGEASDGSAIGATFRSERGRAEIGRVRAACDL